MKVRLDRTDLWLCVLALLLGLGVTTAVAWVPLSQAHFSPTGQYSHDTASCGLSTNRKDPVMDVFYNNGTGSNVATHVQHHTGWTNTDGGQQWYKIHDPTMCAANGTTAQRASSCGDCARVHIRFRQTYHSDATWGVTALGTPHDEEWSHHLGCNYGLGGHAVHDPWGFQDGRTIIYNNLVASGGHTFGGGVIWGNTDEMPQCNESWVGSLDGKVDFVRMP